MEENSNGSLGDAIRREDSRLDNQAKFILGHRSLAAFILKAIRPEFTDIGPDEIARKYLKGIRPKSDVLQKGPNEMNIPGESNRRFDLFFEVSLPNSDRKLWMNLEYQKDYESNVFLRATIYAAQAITGQQTLHPTEVASVWINMNDADKRKNRIYSGLINEYEQSDGLEGPIKIIPVKKPVYMKNHSPLGLYFINVGSEEDGNFTKIFKLLNAVFTGKIDVVKEIYREHNLELTSEEEKEIRNYMTLDEAVRLEARKEERKLARMKVIEILKDFGHNKNEIESFLEKAGYESLTEEEIEKFGL